MFEELSVKEKNIAALVGSFVLFVSSTALYLNLYLRRHQLFSEYGTTDVMEILDRWPIFKQSPYELSIECFYSMHCFIILAIISLLCFIFSLIKFITSGIKKDMKIKSFNTKTPKKMLTKAVNGLYGGEIYISIGRSYDFIEASCSSLYHPDYKYKRFPCNFDGYLSAFNWVTETAEEIFHNRIATVSLNSYTESKYPRCYDWTETNKMNEPCQLSIELNF